LAKNYPAACCPLNAVRSVLKGPGQFDWRSATSAAV